MAQDRNIETTSLHYRLDTDDRIVETGGNWDDFALANDGASILAERVLGTRIFDHVHGDVSAMFLRTLLDGARILQRTSTRPYRCDSPRIKRFMEMTLSPAADGSIMVSHRLLKTAELPGQLSFAVRRGLNRFVVRCSMCNRVKIEGLWNEPEAALAAGKLREAEENHVIYGVCGDCLADIRSDASR